MNQNSTQRVSPATSPWLVLVFIAFAQLVISLDIMVVSIALPSLQVDLGMADEHRQWVMAGYTIAYGACLLIGGRLGDSLGHRRTFLIGMAGFGFSSLAAGLSSVPAVFIAARVGQGLAGAMLSPASLALVNIIFTEKIERTRALGVYSAVSSSGMVLGFVVGGAITQYLGWRWTFHLTVMGAVLAWVGAWIFIQRGLPHARHKFDVPGALLSAASVTGMVLLAASAQQAGLVSFTTLALAVGTIAATAALIWVEGRTAEPLLPLSLFTSRYRIGAYLVSLTGVMGMFGLLLLLTYYLQHVRAFSPLTTGLGFLPLVVALAIGSTQIAGRFHQLAPATLITGGYLLAGTAVVLMTRLSGTAVDNPILLLAAGLLGIGLGMSFTTCTAQATAGIEPTTAGIGSAMFGVVQQVGAGLGAVVLNGVAVNGVKDYLARHPNVSPASPAAMLAGYAQAQWVVVGLLACGIVVGIFLIGNGWQPPHGIPDDDSQNTLSCRLTGESGDGSASSRSDEAADSVPARVHSGHEHDRSAREIGRNDD